MKLKFLSFASISLLSLFILISCNKENPVAILDTPDELAIATDEMQDEVLMDDIFDEILNDILEDEFFKSTGCPLKTVETPDSTRFPRVVTKDYGDGCEAENGVFHSGILIITYDSNPKIPGSARNVEYINFGRNDIIINGSEVIKYRGITDEGYVHYSINGSINLLKPDSVEVKRVKHKERFKIAGIDTPERGDDEWLIEGRVKVTKSTGIQYLMKIVSPLHKVNSCDYLVSGSKFITVDQNAEEPDTEIRNEIGTILIDFGDGTCDNIATKSINDGEPEEIILK